MTKGIFKDETGNVYGRLTVIERAPVEPGSRSAASWIAECACGTRVVARGSALRKANGRRSCGCASSGRPPKPEVPAIVTRWFVIERDGLSTLVRSDRGEEVIVEAANRAWSCSDCGEFPLGESRKATTACEHVMAATRELPMVLALEIASAVIPPPRAEARSSVPKANMAANVAAQTVALERSAEVRQAKVSEFDEEHRRITAPVVVRQATEADLARLAERRAAKRRRLGRTGPDEKPGRSVH